MSGQLRSLITHKAIECENATFRTGNIEPRRGRNLIGEPSKEILVMLSHIRELPHRLVAFGVLTALSQGRPSPTV